VASHRFRTARDGRTTTERGYGTMHQQERARWATDLKAAGSLPCTRCAQPVYHGTAWHLDHSDDRATYLGVAHARCNRRDGARRGRARQNVSPLRW
jgi:hypothetical protein